MQEHDNKEQGFTLIELLVAIVVVGILTAVAIVGIGGLTNKGNNAACSTSVDAARAASAVYYANTGTYAGDFDALTGGTNPALTLQGGVTAYGRHDEQRNEVVRDDGRRRHHAEHLLGLPCLSKIAWSGRFVRPDMRMQVARKAQHVGPASRFSPRC